MLENIYYYCKGGSELGKNMIMWTVPNQLVPDETLVETTLIDKPTALTWMFYTTTAFVDCF